ncbi:MAG: SAM-dependent chlorinase/fluorinase [Deltaproteobacteria bacterium]|nr:SAM-dependent chlorinase/fluorinase [Deltaproteobacteria bacterium]
MTPPLALLTDFGLADPWVGVMKGVILSVAPGLSLVDLAHEVPPGDVLAGALHLDAAVDFFPPDTLFLAVVDPGVGTARRALAARVGSWRFVLPDNGLLTAVLERHPLHAAWSAEDPAFHLSSPGRTFEGRDVFAPVAAWWMAGTDPARFGPAVADPIRIPMPRARRVPGGWEGEVLLLDRFGNAVTDLPAPPGAVARAAGVAFPVASTYGAVPAGASLAVEGSTGRLELAVNGGSAATIHGLVRGTPVRLEVPGT